MNKWFLWLKSVLAPRVGAAIGAAFAFAVFPAEAATLTISGLDAIASINSDALLADISRMGGVVVLAVLTVKAIKYVIATIV